MNKSVFLVLMNAAILLLCNFAFAEENAVEEDTSAHTQMLDKNTAQMQAMDKITGRVSKINVPVGGAIKFGSLTVVIRSCKTRPEEETPDNFAFAEIADKTLKGESVNIFSGWMISSSPATHAVEHPIYDVWLLKCIDEKVDKSLLLDEEKLAEIENLPRLHQHSEQTSVSTQITEIQDAEHKEPAAETQPMNETEFLYDEEEITEEAETLPADEKNTVTEAIELKPNN